MCIVIDSCSFNAVFNENNAKHCEFSAVKKWIAKGRGFVVFGGSGVKAEYGLSRLRLLRMLREQGRAVAIQDAAVDAMERAVRRSTAHTQCNDQHFIALLGASRCSLICSDDKEAYSYYKDKALYPQGMKRVRIYSSRRHGSLLTNSDKASLTNVEQ